MFLKFSQNSQENNCVRVSFLIKLQAWRTPFFIEHLRRLLLDSQTGVWKFFVDENTLPSWNQGDHACNISHFHFICLYLITQKAEKYNNYLYLVFLKLFYFETEQKTAVLILPILLIIPLLMNVVIHLMKSLIMLKQP